MTSLCYLGPLVDEDVILAELSNRKMFAVDTETISLTDRACIGIGLCAGEHRWYFPWEIGVPLDLEPGNKHKDLIKAILSDCGVTKLYHNIDFDYKVLEEALECSLDWVNIQDSYLLARAMGLKAGLQDIGENLLGYTDMFSIQSLLEEAKEQGVKHPTMLDVPMERTALKCMNDVRATWYGWWELINKASAEEIANYRVDMDLLPVLRKMEQKGLGLNHAKLNELQDKYLKSYMEKQFTCEELGFSPGSNQQVAHWLASNGCVLPFTKSRKNLSVDEETLTKLNHPVADVVLGFREDQKMLSTYINPWIGEKRARYHFRGDLSTGRLASYDRNIQNVPPDLRCVFAPDRDSFSWFDYSQVELRVFAALSHDPVMVEAYANNVDIHQITKDELGLPTRLLAKTFNFAMIFYAKTGTLAGHTGLPYQQCDRFRNAWLSTYRGGFQYMRERSMDGKSYAETVFGRKLRLPDADSNYEREHQAKCRINYPVQGTAADIIKRAMLLCDRYQSELDLRIQVHDELVFDGVLGVCKDGCEKCKNSLDIFREMELDKIAPGILTPFEVEHSEVWK